MGDLPDVRQVGDFAISTGITICPPHKIGFGHNDLQLRIQSFLQTIVQATLRILAADGQTALVGRFYTS